MLDEIMISVCVQNIRRRSRRQYQPPPIDDFDDGIASAPHVSDSLSLGFCNDIGGATWLADLPHCWLPYHT